MSMLPEEIIPICMNGERKVFDFVIETGQALITDYHCLDKMISAESSNAVRVDGEKNRKKVTSVAELREVLREIMEAAMDILSRHTLFVSKSYACFEFNDIRKDLLVDQMVFDVLFDKYLNESELMTRNKYSTFMSEKFYMDVYQRENCSRAINENLVRGMKEHYDRMKYSNLGEQLALFGVNANKYNEYYDPKMRNNSKSKKPKYIWDCFYYNYGLNLQRPISDDDFKQERERRMITARQYKRQFTRDNRNYAYEEIFHDLKKLNDLVDKLLPAENESCEKYFNMSMDYYVYESYKRIDFMIKLIKLLPKVGIQASEIDRKHFLVKRFVPLVIVPRIQDNELCFYLNNKYYRPLFIIEEELHSKMQSESDFNHIYYEDLLNKYYYVRAKTYELFKYHCEFISSDYRDIKDFLCKCYNMRLYHESNEMWKMVRSEQWEDMSIDNREKLKRFINDLMMVSEAFFWKSDDREFTVPKNEK